MEGGATILHDLNKNHHKAILGIKFINPLLINKLQGRITNKWEDDVSKDANQLVGIRKFRLTADRSEDWKRKLRDYNMFC